MSLPERAPGEQRESQTPRLESPRTPNEPPAEAAFEGKSAYLVLFSQIVENPQSFTDARLGIGGAQN